MKYLRGTDVVAGQICEALGLEKEKVRRIRFDLEAGDIATVEVEYFMLEEEGKGLVPLLKRYALVPHPDTLPHVVRPEIEAAVDEP